MRRPFRKRVLRPAEIDLVLLRGLQEAFLAAQQADMKRRLDEQIARIEATPITRFAWTPVVDPLGRVQALAWKNDSGTALRLLEAPGQGWA